MTARTSAESLSHRSMLMRAIGLVAHVNPRAQTSAEPEVTRTGRSENGRPRPIRHATAATTLITVRAASSAQRSRTRRKRDRPSRAREQRADESCFETRVDGEAEHETGGDERDSCCDGHVLEIDVRHPEPQGRGERQRPGERTGEQRPKRNRERDREGSDGHNREDQRRGALVEVRHGLIWPQRLCRARGQQVQDVRELVEKDPVELGGGRHCLVRLGERPRRTDRPRFERSRRIQP